MGVKPSTVGEAGGTPARAQIVSQLPNDNTSACLFRATRRNHPRALGYLH